MLLSEALVTCLLDWVSERMSVLVGILGLAHREDRWRLIDN